MIPVDTAMPANPTTRPAFRIAVILLLCVHAVLAISSIRNKSNTFDETIHIAAGLEYWRTNEYRFQPENGNLPQRLAALPLLFADISLPNHDQDVWHYGHELFYGLGNDAAGILWQSRLMILVLSLMLAVHVCAWASRIFGAGGGLVALTLYVLSPSILAHARLATSDMAAALFFMLAADMLWQVVHRVTPAAVIGTILSITGLVLSKMSGILVIPLALILCMARLQGASPVIMAAGKKTMTLSRPWTKAGAMAGVAMVVALAVTCGVWTAYGGRFSATGQVHPDTGLSFLSWEQELSGLGRLGPPVAWMRDHRILPEAYLYGLTYVLNHARARPAFLNGQFSETGWWFFFPFAFGVKTPLTTLLMAALAVMALIWHRSRRAGYHLFPLMALMGVYWAVAMTSNINIGHRHILVTYPVVFILAAGIVRWRHRLRRSLAAGLMALLVLVYLVETLTIWPHYLAFFNTAAGGPQNGYRHLIDSSLDWGQDLPGLKQWLDCERKRRGQLPPVYQAYFGTASPAYFKIPARHLVFRNYPWTADVAIATARLQPGLYCISATALQQVYGMFGGWSDGFMAAYQQSALAVVALDGRHPGLRARLIARYGDEKTLGIIAGQFAELQFAKLCHGLRHRDPDHMVGYSILIYDLSGRDLQTVLARRAVDGYVQNHLSGQAVP